jgi:hypothetical protein
MRRHLSVATVLLVGVVVVGAAAQVVRPDRTNPPIDARRTIQAHAGTGSALPAILDRPCRDCHSNATIWPGYVRVAPLSWLMARAVREGRRAVNFSEWAGYSPEQRRILLAASCQDASAGKMPLRAWTLLHPEAKLSTKDVRVICEAAR